jgi:hypothetical protein
MSETRFPVTVILDVDNTLLEYSEYEFCVFGRPKPGARSFLARQKAKGRTVRLFTTRADIELESLRSHLETHDMMRYVDHIQCGKPFGDIYIDDRAVAFRGNFDGIEDDVEKLLKDHGRNLGFTDKEVDCCYLQGRMCCDPDNDCLNDCCEGYLSRAVTKGD